MGGTTFGRVVWVPIVMLTLSCQGATGPSLLADYKYVIVYSDSGARSSSGSFGGFASSPTQGGLWEAVYFIGDSIQVTQILPNSQCPTPLTVPLGTTSPTADSASVIVRHKRISSTRP